MLLAAKRFLVATSLLVVATVSNASIIGTGAFTSGNLLDFEDAPSALIDNFYTGISFSNISGGSTFDTGTGDGSSLVASNFFDVAGFPAGEIFFANTISRAGFFITTNADDDTTITAFLGTSMVGYHTFDTGGAGYGGSFAGIEFLSGFDRIVIDPANSTNGAFSIDDLRWDLTDVSDQLEVSEPVPITTLGAGILTLILMRRLRRN